ncbi:putative sulfate exporter family transporter, partial [Bordetella pertussis]
MTTTTSTLPLPTPWRDKLNGILFVALMAAAVVQLADLPFIRQFGFSPLVVGIVCGMLYGNFLRGTMPADWGAGVHFTARRLLRIAVAFYGLNISIQQIAAVGLPGLAVSVGVVASTLLIGTVAGQRLRAWWTQDVAMRPWRRLLNEIQMVWYEHPVNEARAARGAAPINALWLYGGA